MEIEIDRIESEPTIRQMDGSQEAHEVDLRLTVYGSSGHAEAVEEVERRLLADPPTPDTRDSD